MSDDIAQIYALDKEVAILKTKLEAAEKALSLAQNNTHVIIAEIFSIMAIVASIFAILHK